MNLDMCTDQGFTPTAIPTTHERLVPPVVYIGRICRGVTDGPDFNLQEFLSQCGLLKSVKRRENFCFAEFISYEGAFFCLKALNGFELGSRKLIVLMEEKVERMLGDYLRNKPIQDSDCLPALERVKKYAVPVKERFAQNGVVAEARHHKNRSDQEHDQQKKREADQEIERRIGETRDSQFLADVFGVVPVTSAPLPVEHVEEVKQPEQHLIWDTRTPYSRKFRDNPREVERNRKRTAKNRERDQEFWEAVKDWQREERRLQRKRKHFWEDLFEEERAIKRKRRTVTQWRVTEDFKTELHKELEEDLAAEAAESTNRQPNSPTRQPVLANLKEPVVEALEIKYEDPVKIMVNSLPADGPTEVQDIQQVGELLQNVSQTLENLAAPVVAPIPEMPLEKVFKGEVESATKPVLPLLNASALDARNRKLYEENTKEKLKELIKSLPSDPESLFPMKLNYPLMQKYNVFDEKIRPFMSKWLIELFGECSPQMMDTLLHDIVENQISAYDFLENVATPIFQEEAEGFVVKLWRALIFESLRAELRSA